MDCLLLKFLRITWLWFCHHTLLRRVYQISLLSLYETGAISITGIGTAEGWLYLAAIVDIYSRLVVGWAMSKQRDEQLVIQAAKMAITQRRPGAGLVHHSDRGSQYTSQGYLAVLKATEIQVSMSNKGDCYDNALMESFFGTLKEECVERQSYQTRAEARSSVFEYIEVFYNRQRRHSSLGYVSPIIYEQKGGEIQAERT
jgi:putative transposase